MTNIRIAAATLSVAALSLVGIATATAQATPSAPAGARSALPLPAADGNFYAYANINYGGTSCAWAGDDSDWTTCSGGNLRNQASSVWNNGYAASYDDVLMYWTTGYGGANKCVARGGYIADLGVYAFPNNGSGGGQTLNNNISGHKWAPSSTC